MSKVKIKAGGLHLAKSKKIKIECPDGVSWKTRIYLDDKDLLKMLPGIRGIEFKDFVDGVIELKLHLTAQPTEFIGEAKVIEIFGEENYCLVNREYVGELKKRIDELRKESKEQREELSIVKQVNKGLKK